MKPFITFFTASSLALLLAFNLASCASAQYLEATDEMGIHVVESDSIPTRHYSPEEMAELKVLVINTKNTERMIEYLDKQYEKKSNSSFSTAALANDYNKTILLGAQETQFKTYFPNAVTEAADGETYDLIVLKDFHLKTGSMSGRTTTTRLSYYFVYEANGNNTSDNSIDYIYRGSVKATGTAKVPYPATDVAARDSNTAAINAMNTLLQDGIDVYVIDAIENPVLPATTATAQDSETAAGDSDTATAGTGASTGTAATPASVKESAVPDGAKYANVKRMLEALDNGN